MKTDRAVENIYMNPAQQRILAIDAFISIIVAGRRFGKTHGVIAPKLTNLVMEMPGSSIGIVVPSYKRGLTNTLPGTFKALEDVGLKRDLHWCIGRRPPKLLNYTKPLIEPACYDYVMSWFNGTNCYLISQDIDASANGLTLDAIIGDEARFLNFDKLKTETFPANGGTTKYFGDKHCHHSMMFVSDMPVGKKGSWFLNYKDQMEPELIEVIEGLYYEIWMQKLKIQEFQAKGVEPPAYLPSHINYLQNKLNTFRKEAIYYTEFSSLYNAEVIGLDYIKQMKRDLPPLTFQTSIMCKRVGINNMGFYNNMKEKHIYTNDDIGYLESLDYHFDKLENEPSSLSDADVNREQPICIGMDYNANINWMVAGQPSGSRLNVIKSFYVKYERKIPELVDDFCKYYRYHRCKEIIYYYDSTALGSNYAVNDEDFKQVVISSFMNKGWRVTDVGLGNPMRHMEKHLLINDMFAGRRKLMPFFNEYNNEDLLIAIQTTGVYNGKKDKRGEKLAESEEDPLELRTDGTDAFDTLVIGCERFPQLNTSGGFFLSGMR